MGKQTVGLLVILLTILLTACGENAMFEKNKALPEAGWSIVDTSSFIVPISDTNKVYNFALNIRNNNNYPYYNLFVFIDTQFPNGKFKKDTVEVYLANPTTGEWFGSGMSGLYFNSVLYNQARFPDTGVYNFSIRHAMRDTILEGITDVGFKLEEAKKIVVE